MELLIILATLGAEPIPLCIGEGATNCLWRSDIQGNGQGRSFVAITLHEGGAPSIIYLDTFNTCEE